MSPRKTLLLSVFGILALSPGDAWACACGCGVFDVGTGTMMPGGEGGTVWFEYDYMNQTENWHNASSSAKENNDDKALRSDFFHVGGNYMFNREWGITGTLPFTHRTMKMDDGMSGLMTTEHTAFGDAHVQGVYSGFSDDMSTGVTFGLKLPTGDFSFSGFDRDSAIGSGSTDLLLGFYHVGPLSSAAGLNWFTNGQMDRAFMTQQGYRPGDEYDGALGAYREFKLGDGYGKLSPLLQVLGAYRVHDTGSRANPSDSGYGRLLISPGLEYDVSNIKLYGDVEVPIYQNVNGNQLVSPVQMKLIVGYSF